MKNKILISTISMMVVIPAFADITTNNNNPTCDSTTIGTTSGSTALDAVWNIVNQTCSAGQYFDMTTATCVTCTANSYCPGGTYNVESQTNGLNSCPSGYGLSASGAGAQTDCYRNCTTSDVAHSTGVTGGYYYGDNNQCGATSCAPGWHLKAGNDLATQFSVNFGGIVYMSESNDGTTSYDGYDYGHTDFNTYKDIAGLENGEWSTLLVSGRDGGPFFTAIKGRAICSTQRGYRDTINNNDDGWNNPTTFANLTDERTQTAGAKYCYCALTGYKELGSNTSTYEDVLSNNSFTAITSSWVFVEETGDSGQCGEVCTERCAEGPTYGDRDLFRAMFATVAPSLASCEANTINITWYNEGSVHDENTCTYAESVTLPETDPQRTGYNFTGWTVRPASTPNQ